MEAGDSRMRSLDSRLLPMCCWLDLSTCSCCLLSQQRARVRFCAQTEALALDTHEEIEFSSARRLLMLEDAPRQPESTKIDAGEATLASGARLSQICENSICYTR